MPPLLAAFAALVAAAGCALPGPRPPAQVSPPPPDRAEHQDVDDPTAGDPDGLVPLQR